MRTEPKYIVWFSCGAPSAVCGKLAIEEYGFNNVELCYCNTFAYEHPDNKRFILDVGVWLNKQVKILSSKQYKDIFDVFDKTGWLVGPKGARCTTELKKKVREDYEIVGDTHIFGLTVEEYGRVNAMTEHHHDLKLDFILYRKQYTRDMCLQEIKDAGIRLPTMYTMGYNNNNCIGCVKGGKGYWNKIRKDFPLAFKKMAEQERKMGTSIFEGCYLDELDPKAGNHKTEHSFECGVMCQVNFNLK